MELTTNPAASPNETPADGIELKSHAPTGPIETRWDRHRIGSAAAGHAELDGFGRYVDAVAATTEGEVSGHVDFTVFDIDLDLGVE